MDVRGCVARLQSRREPAALIPSGVWDAELDREIERLLPDTSPLKSALFLWNDNLTRAHEIAQEIKTQTGSYLHGVMHRREPDYENSKYWFRNVGDHPNFPSVREAALDLLREKFSSLVEVRKPIETSKTWDAFRMVDWCRDAERGKVDETFAGSAREVALPGLPRIRTCPIKASGSSESWVCCASYGAVHHPGYR